MQNNPITFDLKKYDYFLIAVTYIIHNCCVKIITFIVAAEKLHKH